MVCQEEERPPKEASSTLRRVSGVAGTCCSTGVIWCLTAGYWDLRSGTLEASDVVGRRRATVVFELLTDFDVVQVGDARLLGLDVAGDMLLTAPDTHVRVACLGLTRKNSQRRVCAAELRPQLLPELLEHVIV